MARERVEFENARGERLAGLLEVPERTIRAYALFAHCFTCGKDIAAAARIARELAAGGIGVLRFDFTGIGSSEGEFANTGFKANVEDLVAAADWMRGQRKAPGLLVGHSLGGTAVLYAGARIPEVRAVVTIGAPASPEHLIHSLRVDHQQIEREGAVDVEIAGRTFAISRSFLEGLRTEPLETVIGRWKKALLVMHAPFDEVVPIEEAGKIFQAARHPKSFIAIDGADHLLSSLDKAQYVAATIAAWVSAYLPEEAPKRLEVPGGMVWVGEGNRRFLRDIYTDDHHWLADEPRKVGGDNLGPDPYEHLLAALGACTSMTLRLYANRKGWALDDVRIRMSHTREHAADCEACDDAGEGLEVLNREIAIEGELSEQQRARLFEIADRCPVHRTLAGPLEIRTEPCEAEDGAG